MLEKFFENRKAKRDEEYKRTLEAYEGVGRATEDLDKAVDDLGKVDVRIEKKRIETLIGLEESKLNLARVRKDEQMELDAQRKIGEYKKRLGELEQQL